MAKRDNRTNNDSTRTDNEETLHQLAQDGLLKTIGETIKSHSLVSRYCCGGSVDSVIPLVLRIDGNSPENAQVSRRFELPFLKTTDDHGSIQPGIFDETQFGINFDPQKILNDVRQNAFPDCTLEYLGDRPGTLSLDIKLSHLLVESTEYTALDLIEKMDLMEYDRLGTLIVSLPCYHDGGELKVNCSGHLANFSLGGKGSKRISWAAYFNSNATRVGFSSGGQRILLAYKLAFTEHTGGHIDSCEKEELQGGHQVTSFPVYRAIAAMLEQAIFMKQGGTLAFYCRHRYFHTDPEAAKLLPHALHGVDFALYQTFLQLGCKVRLRPVLPRDTFLGLVENKYEAITGLAILGEEENVSGGDCTSSCCVLQHPFEKWRNAQQVTSVGTEFHGLRFYAPEWNRQTTLSDAAKELQESWPHENLQGVVWLNKVRSPGCKGSVDQVGQWELAVVDATEILYHIDDANRESLPDKAPDLTSPLFFSHLAIFIEARSRCHALEKQITNSY